jgi:hypothetical protein
MSGRLQDEVAIVVGAGQTPDEARFITGVPLPVDGGQSARIG